jgi:predicted CoA-substrate-specific enzyme activase
MAQEAAEAQEGDRMIAAGIDIGSTACKAVILKDGQLAGYAIGPSTTNPGKNAKDIFEKAMQESSLKDNQADYVVGTGYGRAKVAFAHENVSELTCHGRGAVFANPSTRTVLDIGGQDTKAILVDPDGFLQEYAMNDKCAAGTGRFLEAMARTLGVTVDKLDDLAASATKACVITSMCSVFAESEVINLINEGAEAGQIAKGLYNALAGRVTSLARRVGIEQDVILTGGVAKSSGVRDAIAEKLGVDIKALPDNRDPQIIGALGAAVIASEKSS